MKIQNLPIVDISDCLNITDIIRKLNLPNNGKSTKLIKDYILLHNLCTKHFDMQHKNRIYPLVTKECPVCNKAFIIQLGHPKEKRTCSYSCANTHFRSGYDNPNYKEDTEVSYRRVCFRHHKKECIICGESNIVAVHHYNENHDDNTISNLVPMCPTHHQYMHSGFADIIKTQVDKYVNDFIESQTVHSIN